MSDRDGTTGKSPHAFMREALGAQSRLLEQRQALLAAALRADRDALEAGSGYGCAEVDAYFEARAAQRPAHRPALRRWRK